MGNSDIKQKHSDTLVADKIELHQFSKFTSGYTQAGFKPD